MKAVPQLRFPGFDGPWRPARAGDAFRSRRARGEAGLPIYSVTLDRGMVPRDSLERRMDADAADGANLRALPGDLVYNMMRMWQGAVGLSAVECMVSPAYVVLDPKDGISAPFFDQWFKNDRMRHLLGAYSHGITSDRLRLYFDDFGRIPIHLPSLAEQDKISTTLQAFERKIHALSEKKDGLIAFKTALMVKLFSQELRLSRPDGSGYPDWVDRPLAELSSWTSGGTPSMGNPAFWNGDIPWISASSMHEVEVSDSNRRVTSASIGRGTRIASKDSILLLVRGSMLYKRIPVCIAARDVAFNQDVKALSSRCGISVKFLFYWLCAHEELLLSMVTGTGIGAGKLETTEVQNLIVSLPSPEEQLKLVGALSSVDEKIHCVGQQIELMIEFRQGLLQQLFV